MKALAPLLFWVLSLLSSTPLLSQNWEEQAKSTLPPGYGIFSMSIVDENIVWAVAYDITGGSPVPSNHVTLVLKTLNGGRSWSVNNVTEATGRISFDIVAFDSTTAFITTQDFNSGRGRGVFKTSDGGDTWVEKFRDVSGGVWIRFFDRQEGIVINRQLIAKTFDGGETWQAISNQNFPTFQSDESTIIGTGNNSCEVVGDHIWFGTDKGRIYRSKDRGNTWEAFRTSLGSDALILSVAFKDTLNGIISNSATLPSTLATTKDGGETWTTRASFPLLPIRNLEFVPNTDSTLVATSGLTQSRNRLLAFSTDFGGRWQLFNNLLPFGSIAFISPTVGWVANPRVFLLGETVMYKWNSNLFTTSNEDPVSSFGKIYPNPFSEDLHVSSLGQVTSFRLLSIDGKLIQSQNLEINEERISFQHLQPGAYILELIMDDGTSFSERIFKVD
ncbi:MAG: YCF48-related protein [Bacteroidota bacterium]